MITNEYHSPLYQDYRRRMIDAVKLAGHFDGLYYAEIDGMIDFDIHRRAILLSRSNALKPTITIGSIPTA